ncbi:hypothetical protein BY458DRAFT_493311 [Sporodiniella umbellata]|nr:hypothetical protein BY458DRAFT_493311 [Sporodiniella umbellata]
MHKSDLPSSAQSTASNEADPAWMPSYSTQENKRTKLNSNSTSLADMKVEKNTEGKPPYSYATLIKYAIERSPGNKLTLSQIYQWVIEHYPYYGNAGSGWKNSIRHNLSLNKSFVRMPRPVNEPGKGSYWTVDQYAQQNQTKLKLATTPRCKRASSNEFTRSYSRSLSTDAGPSRHYYCSHPYSMYYSDYRHDPWLSSSSSRSSNVTYSLPQSTMDSLKSYDLYGSPRYPHMVYPSHRQSCPDIASSSPYTGLGLQDAQPMASTDKSYHSPSSALLKGSPLAYDLPSPVLSTSRLSSPTDQYTSPSPPLVSPSLDHSLRSPYYNPVQYFDINESSCTSSPLQAANALFNDSLAGDGCIKTHSKSNLLSSHCQFDY